MSKQQEAEKANTNKQQQKCWTRKGQQRMKQNDKLVATQKSK